MKQKSIAKRKSFRTKNKHKSNNQNVCSEEILLAEEKQEFSLILHKSQK